MFPNFSVPHQTAINIPGTQGWEKNSESWKEEPKQVEEEKAEGTSLGVEVVTERTHFYISKLEVMDHAANQVWFVLGTGLKEANKSQLAGQDAVWKTWLVSHTQEVW